MSKGLLAPCMRRRLAGQAQRDRVLTVASHAATACMPGGAGAWQRQQAGGDANAPAG